MNSKRVVVNELILLAHFTPLFLCCHMTLPILHTLNYSYYLPSNLHHLYNFTTVQDREQRAPITTYDISYLHRHHDRQPDPQP